MPFTLTPETGAGVTDANTYCSVADADAYHERQLRTEKWQGAQDAHKQQALAMATRLLDENVRWHGTPVLERTTPAWPRTGMYDAAGVELASTILPPGLVEATAEFALRLIEEDRVRKAEESPISLSVPKGSRSFRPGYHYSVVPPGILDRLATFIQPAGGGRIMRVG